MAKRNKRSGSVQPRMRYAGSPRLNCYGLEVPNAEHIEAMKVCRYPSSGCRSRSAFAIVAGFQAASAGSPMIELRGARFSCSSRKPFVVVFGTWHKVPTSSHSPDWGDAVISSLSLSASRFIVISTMPATHSMGNTEWASLYDQSCTIRGELAPQI